MKSENGAGGGGRKTSETKNCFLEKINKIGKTSARLTKEKKTEDPMTTIKN